MQINVRDLNKKQTPEEFLKENFGSNLREAEEVQTASFKGYTAITKGKTPFGTQDTRIAVVFKGKQVYQFLAAAEDETLPTQI